MIINDTYGVTFNNWNDLYHRNGRENGGTEWLEHQLITLQCAIDNAKGLDKHYTNDIPEIKKWNYNGKN